MNGPETSAQSTPEPVAAPAGLFGKIGHIIRRLLGGGEPYRIKETTLLVVISLFMALAYNAVFFSKVLAIYPPGLHYLLFHASIFVVVVALMVFLLALVSSKFTTKPLAVLLFFLSSLVCYFVNTYGVVVDVDMLQNVVETNVAESLDLLSVQLGLYVLFLGILPGVIVWRLKVTYRGILKTLLGKAILIACSLALIAGALFSSASTFASFFREHKPVRAYVNPAGYIYAVGKLVAKHYAKPEGPVRPYAMDARVRPHQNERRLVILVVGETARADHFSLNGYARETNPLLKRETIVNFSNVMAAGTSTAISVPAMFSHLGREEFDGNVARNTENILDILARVGVSVLWRDNNSDSKGVAVRLTYEDFKNPDRNPICDDECRDEGMLVDLQDYIDQQTGDVMIVLHSMGNHGPAYYKRYPKAFEVFTPVCKSNRLEQCSAEEINNAYDNAILYTDYFLSKVIALLKRNDDKFETAMMYFSDHGESLGENNMYLHGYPYALAPMEQKHVPAVFWFGSKFPLDLERIRAKSGEPYSHDNIFHTLLGLFEVETTAYDPSLDMVSKFVRDKR
ncbi:MAG: phosphoethanolamine--lipid A transferase [Cephaloticoccus sp.]|nr:phosphoethanolamine--lipid A transferase [Cephaloticoccus sp.]MCF7760668.1 phosphoethanolamine--lipid A transferase [Cephaloticoccus sp.]